jgi:hypothetical protein
MGGAAVCVLMVFNLRLHRWRANRWITKAASSSIYRSSRMLQPYFVCSYSIASFDRRITGLLNESIFTIVALLLVYGVWIIGVSFIEVTGN